MEAEPPRGLHSDATEELPLMQVADSRAAIQDRAGSPRPLGVLNIGNNPTINNKGRSVEVYIFDFNEDIYDQPINILFIDRLRSEIRFDNLDLLTEQIKADEIAALQVIRSYKK